MREKVIHPIGYDYSISLKDDFVMGKLLQNNNDYHISRGTLRCIEMPHLGRPVFLWNNRQYFASILYIGFPSQFNINSIQIDFQIIQFHANLYAHLKVYFNLQIRRFNFNNCSSDLVHQSFNLIKQAFNRQQGSINFIKSARN